MEKNWIEPEDLNEVFQDGRRWSIEQHRQLLHQLQERLKPSRLQHTYAVAEEAVRLAAHYGESRGKAQLAALFHDICRNLPLEDMNRMAAEADLPIRYRNNPNLAHSKLAVKLMKREYGITDQELLDAVSYHTTGRSGMSRLEKILFLADAIEPGRNYPGVDEIRALAYEDLDQACISSLQRTVEYIREQDAYLDPDTEAARDDLKEKLK